MIDKESQMALKKALFVGELVANELISSHDEYKHPLAIYPKGIIRQFAINSSFINAQIYGYNENIEAVSKRIGKRDYTFLKLGNTILSLGKTKKAGSLPSPAKYKEQMAKNCNKHFKELQLSVFEDDNKYYNNLENYGILTYDINDLGFIHATIVFPDEEYKKSKNYIDLNIHDVDIDEDEVILGEKDLKQKVLEKYNKIMSIN